MKSNKFPIFIGPYTGKVTGQNLMFILATEAFENKLIIDTAKLNFIDSLKNLFIIIKNVKKINVVYITVSRTRIGFLRDFFYCFIFLFFGTPTIAHLHGSDLNELYQKENQIIKFLMQYYYSSFSCFIGGIPEMINEFSFVKKNIEYNYIINAHEN